MDTTAELMDWAFAEAGYLLDFDEKQAFVFGYPEDVDFEMDDLAGIDAEELDPASELQNALQQGPLDFLQCIAPRWTGWLLHWDDRGVDAFAAHLDRRGIRSVTAQPRSHPPDRRKVSFQA
jgi:hypothetical protein